MKLFLLAFSPVLSGFLVKKLMGFLGLDKMLTLSGALMSGVAGAAKIGGDSQMGDKLASGFDGGLKKHGNKLGNKLGKGDIGTALAEGNVTKATKFLGRSAANPYKAGQKALKHGSDVKGKLTGDLKTFKDNSKSISKAKAAILKMKEKNKNIDNDVAVGIANGNPNAFFGGAVKMKASSLTDRNVANGILSGNEGANKLSNIKKSFARGEGATEVANSHEIRKNSLMAQQDSLQGYNEKQQLAAQHQEMMVSKMIGSGGLEDMTELDVEATRKGLGQEYGISSDNIIVPTNGLPPLVGLSTSDMGFAKLGNDFDSNKDILRNPMHYLSDKDKQRLSGESDDAYSARVHLALESAGMYNPETNAYVDCIEKFNINDSDIALAMSGDTSMLQNYKIDVSGKARAQSVQYSKLHDEKIAKQNALMLSTTKGFLESQVAAAVSSLTQNLAVTNFDVEAPGVLENVKGTNFTGLSSAEKEKLVKDATNRMGSILESTVKELTEKKLAECNALSYVAGDKYASASDQEKAELTKLADNLQKEALDYERLQTEEIGKILSSLNVNNFENDFEEVYKSIERTISSKKNDVNQSNLIASKQYENYQISEKAKLSYTTKIESSNTSKKMVSASKRVKGFISSGGLLNG